MKRHLLTAVCVCLCMALSSCGPQSPEGTETTNTPQPSESAAQESPAAAPSAAASLEGMPFIVTANNIQKPTGQSLSISDAEAAAAARAFAEAAQLYYDKYNEQAELIPRNGFMFDFPAQEYMTSYLLTEGGELDESYADIPPFVLYLTPDRLQGTDGLNVSDSYTTKPVIYAACENENGYALASSKEDCGIMSKDSMEALLAALDSSHGDVRRERSAGEQYAAIDAALKAYRQDESPLDFRYIASDDKYAFAVCSPVDRPLDIRAYALLCENGAWAVVKDGFENEYQFRKVAAEAFPDMNTQLFPEFNLYFQLKYAKTNFSAVLGALKAEGFITENDGALEFISGTNDFVYAAYESGKRFVGYRDEYAEEDGASWDIRPVLTFLDAEVFMKEKDVLPPLFIVKQQ